MPEDYAVQPGDCMSSIAYSHGFFWETLWNLPENAALKAQRKDPNVLMEGDTVHLPDLTAKQQSGATSQRHKFRLKGVPETLSIKLLDLNQKPRANMGYTIVIDGDSRQGTTDGNGMLKESIPPDAKSGKLIVPSLPGADGKPVPGKPATQTIKLQLGALDPVSEPSGVQARLTNLGFYKEPTDGDVNGAMKQALSAFQTKQGLPVTGVADDATTAKLKDVHGH